MLEITLTRGLVGKPEKQRKIVAALGLGKYGSSVKHHANPAINGMLKKVAHLVTVTECKESKGKAKSSSKEKELG